MTVQTVHSLHLRFQQGVLVGGVLLMGIKYWAYWLTQSNAILSDTLESSVNIMAGAFALYSLYLAAQPQDRNHPYGHGKIEFISAGIEGSMIIVAGGVIVAKSIYNLFYPQELSALDTGIYVSVLTSSANYVMGFWAEKKGKQSQSMTLVASGKHLQSDAYSTLGLIIGLVLIYFTQINWLDSAVAILFGVLIAWTGLKVLRSSVAGLMDEADEAILTDITAVLEQNRQLRWIDIHNLRVIKYGSHLHIDCHLTLPYYFTLEQAHGAVKEVEKLVNQHFQNVELFIHADPCRSVSCAICQLTDCAVRQSPFEQKVNWNLQNIRQPNRHQLE